MNVPQTLAIQLSNSNSLSLEQRLFQQALSSVEVNFSRKGARSSFLDTLQHAQTVDGLQYALERVRKSNKLWSEYVGKSWLKNLSKYAECILVYKGLLNSVTSRIGANVASPIWGTLEFVLSTFKDLSSTALKLEDVERTLTSSIERFSRYFANGKGVSRTVQNALIKYYEIVISFAVEVHGEFDASLTYSAFKAVHRTLSSKLSEIKDKIHYAIDDVDKGACLDHFDSIHQEIQTLSSTFSLTVVQQPNVRSSSQFQATRAIHNLPNPNNNFSGRRNYLSKIWQTFQKQTCGQARTAVFGLGGIGKTQLIQKYAYDQFKAKLRRVVMYVDASSPASIRADVLTFMQTYAANLLVDVLDDKQKFGQFHAWLLNQDDWLLVLDNVKDYDDIRGLLPRGDQGQVLCSTRHTLLAGLLAQENVVEVLPMDEHESKVFIARLAANSVFEEDKLDSARELVATHAKGMPLYIEQIIHNAIFSQKTIQTTLSLITEKDALLRQKTVSSLHEDNLSLGGIVMQSFENIRARSDRAGALFGILAYLDSSAIPIQLIRGGSRGLNSFLTSEHTYQPDRRRMIGGDCHTPLDNTQRSSSQSAPHTKARSLSRFRDWSSRFGLSKVPTVEARLPVDDADLRRALSNSCGPGTPYGRLLENADTIDDAILTLRNAAVIGNINPDTLWMHDLVSEVVRALIESDSIVIGQHILVASSIMVYHSLPHPETLYTSSNLKLSNQYLSHALTCHRLLKTAGILNDSCIGPELSHLIASTLTKNLTRDFQVSGERRSQEEIAIYDERILEYYKHAYYGYMAGWYRLRSRYFVTEWEIRSSTIRDRNMEVSIDRYFKGEEYSTRTSRFGCAAPWRAVQTAARLYVHLEQNMRRYSEAEHWLQIVLNFCESIFGLLDEETEYFRSRMIHLLGRCKGDHERAYTLNLAPVADILSCKISCLDQVYLEKIDFAPLLQTARGLEYISTAGSCALSEAQSRCDKNDRCGKVYWAETALFWFGIRLRETRAFHGDALYVLSAEMKDHGRAYELCEKPRTSMYYFAQAVLCTFNTSGPLAELCGPAPSVKLDNIKIYQDAKARLYGETEVASSTAWNNDPELKELIELCDTTSNGWMSIHESLLQDVAEEEEAVDWDAVLAQPFDTTRCSRPTADV